MGSVAECYCKLPLWLPRIIVQASWLYGAEAMLNSWAGLFSAQVERWDSWLSGFSGQASWLGSIDSVVRCGFEFASLPQ